MKLVFDIETNGLLDTLDRVHCIAVIDADSGEEKLFVNSMYREDCDGDLDDALALLDSADLLIGHNITGFDLPALDVALGWTTSVPVFDTAIAAPLAASDVKNEDFEANKRRKKRGHTPMPNKLVGTHKLEAWGWRLGTHKGDYGIERTDWSVYDADMGRYCVQDVRVNAELYHWLERQQLSPKSVEIEHKFTEIIRKQEKAGFRFDVEAATKLEGQLMAERAKLEGALVDLFPPREIVYFTPKKKLRRVKTVPFNPNSRQQVAWHLTNKYGWKPKEHTPNGQAKIDESILSALPYEEAQKLARVFLLTKRLGALSDGRNAWLKLVKDDGRIHGWMKSIGTPHGRCAHYHPNMAQVPGVQSEYGAECRALFCARPGWKIVGADASGIQLRSLAHYMARWDDGEYIDIVVNSDPHEANRIAAGLAERSEAKRLIYAFLFGAGLKKLGTIVRPDIPEFGSRSDHTKLLNAGKRLSEKFLGGFPALAKLVAAVKAASRRGFIKALDGRKVPVRSQHVALNYLLASAEAVIMKLATIIVHEKAAAAGFVWGEDYVQVAHVHDEFQFEARKEIADELGRLAVEAIKQAGVDLGFRCPLDGEYKVGDNWYETH